MCVLVFEENARHKYQAGHQQLFKKYEDKLKYIRLPTKQTKKESLTNLQSTRRAQHDQIHQKESQ